MRTINEVRKCYEQERARLAPLLDIELVSKGDAILRAVREQVTAYYKTAEGREYLENTPYAKMPLEDAMDILMRDVNGWLNGDIDRFYHMGGYDAGTSV